MRHRGGGLLTGPSRLPLALRAFAHRDFRLFFAGHFVSLIGTWMQQVAMSWLVYRLTGSALALGLIGFAGQIPSLPAAPLAGVLADRVDRRRMVLLTQLVSMAQAVLLAALVLTGAVQVWHLVALAVVLGTANGFDVPARQSLLVELVDGPGDLANAIALNSSMFNAARLLGPATAGLLIGWIGEGGVFVLNAASYVFVLWALLLIRPRPRPLLAEPPAVLAHLREGFGYAAGFAPIRTALLALAIVSLVGMPYVVLLPVFASSVLGGGADALGVLMSAAGLGALAGALWLASRASVRGLGRIIVLAGSVFGLGILLFAAARTLWLAAAALAVAGFGVMTFTASINTVLQTLVEEDKRGRVMSLYALSFMGMAPFGSLLAGALAARLGAPTTVALGGAICLLAAAWFARRLPALREEVRPIYVEKGIIPEVAAGIQSASELRLRQRG